jgi:molybdenum-dependent DNA-binding transcriptional regulator ModE
VAQASGAGSEEIAALWQPLARYGQLVQERFSRSWLMRLATPMPWSRFCPSCLTETRGRWQASWRLWWFTTCPVHEVHLAARCPTCSRCQRQRRILSDTAKLHLTTCGNPREGANGRKAPACGHDLTAVPVIAHTEPAALALQRELGAILDPDAEGHLVREAIELLADLLVTAAHVGLETTALDTESLAAADDAVAVLGHAWPALTDPRDQTLEHLVTADVSKRPSPLPRDWKLASTALTTRILAARDAKLCPTDRLRWRTTVGGRSPDATMEQTAGSLAACIPEALWPEWAVRLVPRKGIAFDEFRAAASAMLLIPGTDAPLPRMFPKRSDHVPSVQMLSYVSRLLARDEHGDLILRCLTELSDRLRSEGCPIDYARRRRIAAGTSLLDGAEWDRICAVAGTPTGAERKLRYARLRIYETLTGGDPRHAPPGIRVVGQDTSSYHLFALRIPRTAADLLDRRARQILDTNGCAEEPLSWSPPAHWVNLAGMPGVEPDRVDPREVGRLLRRGLPATGVAERFGTTTDHIWLVVQRHPPQVEPRGDAVRRKVPRRPFPAELTAERLHQLLIVGRRGVVEVAGEFKVSRKLLAAVARRDGITLGKKRSPRVRVDPVWLKAEYVERNRTTADIATELGASAVTVARRLRENGIVVRARGGASHRASLTATEALPEPLAAAARGQHGPGRVRRFRVLARARSITRAAESLGMLPGTLTTQLTLLERDCGGALLIRSTRTHQSQQLTSLGRRLLAQADRHFGADRDAVTNLPEPLASAVASFIGNRRIRWFQVVARVDSFVAAGASLGVLPSSISRSLSVLETACGGVLLVRRNGQRAQSLTPLGRRLVAQADRHLGRSDDGASVVSRDDGNPGGQMLRSSRLTTATSW